MSVETKGGLWNWWRRVSAERLVPGPMVSFLAREMFVRDITNTVGFVMVTGDAAALPPGPPYFRTLICAYTMYLLDLLYR